MRRIIVLGVLLLATLADVTPANTGIKEYEPLPEEGQIIALQDDDANWQPYEVKEVRINTAGMIKHAYCTHLFNELADGPPRSYTLTNATPATSMAAAIVGTRWEVGTIDASLTALTEDFAENYRNPLEFLRIIERDYSARLSFRVVITNHEVTNLYIDLLEIDETFAGQRFEFGHNLKNIEIIVDRDGIKTALVGLAIGNEIDLTTEEPKYLTFEDEVAADKPAGQDWIGDEEARMHYGIPDSTGTMMHRYGVYRSDAQTAATLLTATRVQVGRQCTPKVTVEADVADLEKIKIVDIATGNLVTLDHEKIRLNNVTQVIAKGKGLLAAVELKITRIEKFLKERDKTKVTFGDPIALGSDQLKALEDEMVWKDKRRRQLDRGRGPATVIVASEDSSYQPWYANVIVPAGATNAEDYFQEAIDSLPLSGGKVIVLEGEYIVSDTTTLTSNISFEGQGESTVIKFVSGIGSSIFALYADGKSNIKISNLTIDGDITNVLASNQGLIKIINSTKVRIENCVLQNALTSGITVNSFGIYVSGSDQVTIRSNNGSNVRRFIQIYDCEAVMIDDNEVVSGDFRYGIDIDNLCADVTITGNIFKGATDDGILVYGSTGLTISNNICSGNEGVGIALNYVDDSSITGNTCNNNLEVSTVNTAGIALIDGDDNSITGNTCNGNGYYGIIVGGNRNSVQANKCHNNGQYGIRVGPSGVSVFVTNNDLAGNTVGGLDDGGTTTITTAGNRT